MTAQSDLKKLVRERKAKTGESYSTARMHIMGARAELLALPSDVATVAHLDAVVLKVNELSARIRVFGEVGEITFRSSAAADLIPGQIATFTIAKRWDWKGGCYASGEVRDPRIDVARLGLEPLPLKRGEFENLRSNSEPYRRPDPYAPLWSRLTAKPRACFEMDPIAWGAFPGDDLDDNPTCTAVELREVGEHDRARELLMTTLHRDLRCIDAHAGLGSLEFEDVPNRAIQHYEIGMLISELSLPTGFEGVLRWGRIYNRPYLRCLQGYGLCLWRLGRVLEAERVFERILSLNPDDNQGVRACWHDVRGGRTWEEAILRDEPHLSQFH